MNGITSVYYSALARAKLALGSSALAPVGRLISRMSFVQRPLSRVKRWPARLLLPDQPRWVRVESGLAQGLWLRLNLDTEGGYWIGKYEMPVQDYLKRLCVSGSIFYDIGANLGFFSLAVANGIGPKGKVFAFEPEPQNSARIREMTARNNLGDRLELVEAAVWSYTCSKGVPFRRGGRQRTYGGIEADGVTPVLAQGEMRTVPTVSLDDFIHDCDHAPDVLKVDVEGGECEVLKGAEQLFLRMRPVLICEVHRESAARFIADWLVAKEYAAVWRVPDESFPRLLLAQPIERRLDHDLHDSRA